MFASTRLNARNPGPLTGTGNHTYLLASGGQALLIDAGVGHPAHLDDIDRVLREGRSALLTVVITHGHDDHASGAPALARRHPAARFARYPVPGEDLPGDAGRWQPVRDGDALHAGEDSLQVVHTPGHSPDHIVLWDSRTRDAYTGDLVIAGGSVMIQASGGGDMAQYLRSLTRVLELAPARLWPSHGDVVDDAAGVIRGYLEHRRMRERQVVEAMRAGHRSVEAITESIYHGLAPALMAAAAENVRAHLAKLEADGVAAAHDGWRLL